VRSLILLRIRIGIGIAVLLLAAVPGLAQTVAQSVAGNGGGLAANAGYTLASTAGQAVIGPSAAAGYRSGAGFWYQSGAVYAGITGPPPATETPLRFQLAQNHPNPFWQTTSISFSVPRPCRVSIVLYDVRGREVLTVADEELAPGHYARLLSGDVLADGVYYCRMQSYNFVMTRKIVFLE